MKIRQLIEKLQEFESNDDIVIQTQYNHPLYADIGQLDYKDNNSAIVVMNFKNESYSPKQALKIS